MASSYVWIGAIIGVFFAGLGIGYAVFTSTYNPYGTMYQDPQMFNQMMARNPQFAGQYMGYMMQNPQYMNQWMSTMMQNSQFRQQYLGPQLMMQNPQFMRSMMTGQWYGQLNSSAQSSPITPVESNTVSIAKDSWQSNSTQWYLPPIIHVVAGTTVVWTNNDSIMHTVTDVKGSFDSGLIQPHSSWNHTFNAKGQYQYFCTIHPWMKGMVIVS